VKIPESVRIAGVDYAVIDNVPGLNDGTHMLMGQIDYLDCEIRIADRTSSVQMKGITLWHEILHGIHANSGMELENEEQVIEMFARGIYQVLQDNGRRLFDIVSDPDAP
jgi:hypothetical protein